MILAIDFDGVVHDYKNPIEGKKMGEPIKGAQKALKRFKILGHTIIIFTVRGGQPKHVEDWMKFYKIPYDSITNIKPNADVYLDDKAVKFIGWDNHKKFN